MGVIWRADDTILSSSKDNAILKNTRNGETYKIVIWKHAFTEICLHWLDLQGENKYKDAIQKIATRIEAYDDTGYPRNLANLVEIIEVIVGDCLQDVVKREPENEKILVREFGERIGYGNLMQLASECWQESLKAKGLPPGGAFSVGLPYDLLIKKESEDE